MLSICRLVTLGHGQVDLQQMERYREINFPSEGPAQATERNTDALEQALEAISLEDHHSLSGCQMVLLSLEGRIVAFENPVQRGKLNTFTWGVVAPPDKSTNVLTFMCEQQEFGGKMNPHCFEIIDSLGRSWCCYQVTPGLLDWSEFVEMGGIQLCRREELARQLGESENCADDTTI
jgi:hypothetical protein